MQQGRCAPSRAGLVRSTQIMPQDIPGGQGRTELEYRLAWARTRLKIAGLLTNEGSKSGIWSVTELGLSTEGL